MDEPIDNPPPVLYKGQAVQFRRTPQFDKWLRTLRDRLARSRIVDRLDRLAFGHVGDAKSVGDGVFELRLAFGPGYRNLLYVEGRQADFAAVGRRQRQSGARYCASQDAGKGSR